MSKNDVSLLRALAVVAMLVLFPCVSLTAEEKVRPETESKSDHVVLVPVRSDEAPLPDDAFDDRTFDDPVEASEVPANVRTPVTSANAAPSFAVAPANAARSVMTMQAGRPVISNALQTVMTEGFEGIWPQSPWNVLGGSGPYWDDTSIRSYEGGWSAFCAKGGPGGAVGSYPNDTNSWMIWGPFSLVGSTTGSMSLKYWLNSEPDFDYLSYGVSIDGTNFYGIHTSGNSGGWTSGSLDFALVPGLGNINGQATVYIAVWFNSDSSITAEGAYVDNIVVQKGTAPGVDLRVDYVDAPAGRFTPGQAFSISNSTTNIGDTTSSPYRITFYLSTNTIISTSDTPIFYIDRAALAPGQSHNFSTSGSLPAIIPNGSYYVGVLLTVTDVNSGNNSNYDPTPITVGSTRNDFNGDGKSDIVWRNTATGGSSIWLLNGNVPTGASGLTSLQFSNNSFVMVGAGDFNGDGKADLAWRNNVSGETFMWLMNGTTAIAGSGAFATVPAPWTIVGAGDFNGDGKSDLLWRNPTTGQNSIWLLNANTVLAGSGTIPSVADVGWFVGGIADFNADGKSDILWRNGATGTSSIWFMNGGTVQAGSGPTNLQIPYTYYVGAVGDFNGDGAGDIIWRNSISGENIVWLMNGVNVIAGSGAMPSVPDTGYTPVAVGDFNGDGRDDIIWRKETTGETSVWMLNGATFAPGSGFFGVVPAPWQVVGPR